MFIFYIEVNIIYFVSFPIGYVSKIIYEYIGVNMIKYFEFYSGDGFTILTSFVLLFVRCLVNFENTKHLNLTPLIKYIT